MAGGRPEVYAVWLGPIPFREAYRIQRLVFDTLVQWKKFRLEEIVPSPPQVLFLCEHVPPVITLGKNAQASHVCLPERLLRRKGFEVIQTDRGGDVTYHGPGQLVGYPILDLSQFREDLHWYLRSLEEVIIRVVGEYGIRAERLAGATGVWINPHQPRYARKICAMGIRMSRWVCMHGFALNVNTALHHFSYIIPCGIADKGVTSLAWETGRHIPLAEVRHHVLRHFATVLDCTLTERTYEEVLPQIERARTRITEAALLQQEG